METSLVVLGIIVGFMVGRLTALRERDRLKDKIKRLRQYEEAQINLQRSPGGWAD